MKKVLILSVTAGEGHNATAKALAAEFERQGNAAFVLDTFQYVSPAAAKFLSEGYLLVTDKAKSAYKTGYRLAEKRRGKAKPVVHLVDMAFSDDIKKFIDTVGCDVVLFTHSFAGMILDYMKKKNMISIPTLGILTDFTFHPYWEDCTANDYVFVPSAALLLQGRRKGFRDEQIIETGIPINPRFSDTVPQNEARRQLGLDENTTTILIMGGSMGYGNMAETVQRIDSLYLDRNFQMIVVCGNNKDAKDDLDRLVSAGTLAHKTLVTGFVDYVSLLMDASDCIVTKPGGLTTSESLAKGLPMVIVNPIPGQEERNTEFLLNNGAACAVSKTCPLEDCLYQLLASPARLDAMKTCVKALAHPTSTEDVCRFTISLCEKLESKG
ncbi:MAG: glycosyltransferase [Ruminococcaceae bacterium]|nr:glycosyltransferase [Oscillospiraceae bacterium]